MKKFKINLLLALLLSGVMQASFAADGKNYPGSQCVRWSGSTAITYSASEMQNNSTTTDLNVDCVATKDIIGGKVDAHWVRMRDQNGNSGKDVSCRLWSVYGRTDAAGMWGWSGPLLKTVGSSPYVQHKSTSSDVSSNTVSHYYFSCVIPPRNNATGGKSGIVTYQIDES
ncbi:MAG: hypothetical protein OEY38_02765 [Gammaproteobacteria bacterium]|nr:hypothetical protein [Gammaproteobacteria bacterium]